MGSKVTLGDQLMFPSDYLSAIDLKGRDMTLTIATISKQDVVMRGGKKQKKPVMTFKETPKKVVVNSTNADSIAFMHGKKAEGWVGKQITFFPTTTQFGREVVDCIRVRENGRAPLDSAPVNDPPPADPTPEPTRIPIWRNRFLAAPDLSTVNAALTDIKKLGDKAKIEAAWKEYEAAANEAGLSFDKKAKAFVDAGQPPTHDQWDAMQAHYKGREDTAYADITAKLGHPQAKTRYEAWRLIRMLIVEKPMMNAPAEGGDA